MSKEIIVFIISMIFAACALLILVGKGDWMLSGYNTASPEKRAKYNIHRLRAVSGIGLIIIVAEMMAIQLIPLSKPIGSAVVLVTAIIIAVLSNTYCKR